MNSKALVVFLIIILNSVFALALREGHGLEVAKHASTPQQRLDSLKSLEFRDVCKEIENIRFIRNIHSDMNSESTYDLDSALFYSKLELRTAEALENHHDLVAVARLNCANLFYKQDQIEASTEMLLKNRIDSAVVHPELLAHTESALSNLFIHSKTFDKAVLAGFAAAKAFEDLKDSSNAGFAYLSLADVHSLGLDNNLESLKLIEQAILFLKSDGATKEYLIGATVMKGDILHTLKEYDNSLLAYQQANDLVSANDKSWYTPDILSGMGIVFFDQQDYEKSMEYLEKAIEASNGNAWKSMRAYQYMGFNHQAIGEPAKAIPYLQQCLQNEESIGNYNDLKVHLVQCYEQLNDFEAAFKLQKEIMISRDSIVASEQKEKLTAIIEGFENEKKQLKIAQLSQENIQKQNYINLQYYAMWGLLGFFVLIGLGGYSWLTTRQKLKAGIEKMEKAQLHQRLLRTQLNPHFFFHALSSIEGYIYSNERKNAAGFLRNFSKLMRNILETSDQDFVRLEEDIIMIREYLTLQQLNNDFKFAFTIEVSEEIDPSQWKIPPMLIQPFVENAILHGALNAASGKVGLSYSLEGESLRIRIEDNGPNEVSASRKSGALHRSMSTDITKQRINNLREVHGISIDYSFHALEGESTGSAVTFNIPIIAFK